MSQLVSRVVGAATDANNVSAVRNTPKVACYTTLANAALRA